MLPVLLATVALAASGDPGVTLVDLDRDPEPERLEQVAVRCYGPDGDHAPPCAGDEPHADMAWLVDSCGGAEHRFALLAHPQDAYVSLRAVEADGDPGRPEVVVEGRSGAGARNGEDRVVRLQDGPPGTCPRPRILYHNPGPGWTTRRPRGAAYRSSGYLEVRDVDPATPGREVILRQPWYRTRDAGCCPTWQATAVFRFDRRRDRYVRARERVRRLPPP